MRGREPKICKERDLMCKVKIIFFLKDRQGLGLILVCLRQDLFFECLQVKEWLHRKHIYFLFQGEFPKMIQHMKHQMLLEVDQCFVVCERCWAEPVNPKTHKKHCKKAIKQQMTKSENLSKNPTLLLLYTNITPKSYQSAKWPHCVFGFLQAAQSFCSAAFLEVAWAAKYQLEEWALLHQRGGGVLKSDPQKAFLFFVWKALRGLCCWFLVVTLHLKKGSWRWFECWLSGSFVSHISEEITTTSGGNRQVSQLRTRPDEWMNVGSWARATNPIERRFVKEVTIESKGGSKRSPVFCWNDGSLRSKKTIIQAFWSHRCTSTHGLCC